MSCKVGELRYGEDGIAAASSPRAHRFLHGRLNRISYPRRLDDASSLIPAGSLFQAPILSNESLLDRARARSCSMEDEHKGFVVCLRHGMSRQVSSKQDPVQILAETRQHIARGKQVLLP